MSILQLLKIATDFLYLEVKMRIILFLITFIFVQPCFAQTAYRSLDSNVVQYQPETSEKVETKFKNTERADLMRQDLKKMRGTIGSSTNAVKARNLLMLQEVLNFKMQDETLAPEIAKLRENREFNTKLLKALNELDNKKIRNRKNNEVMDILNNAGGRIYNSLAN